MSFSRSLKGPDQMVSPKLLPSRSTFYSGRNLGVMKNKSERAYLDGIA
jgi:hypothetical protein